MANNVLTTEELLAQLVKITGSEDAAESALDTILFTASQTPYSLKRITALYKTYLLGGKPALIPERLASICNAVYKTNQQMGRVIISLEEVVYNWDVTKR